MVTYSKSIPNTTREIKPPVTGGFFMEDVNRINNEWQPSEFYISSKTAVLDHRFKESGSDGLRAFMLLQVMQDLSTIPNWRFYRKNLANRMRVSLRTLDRAIALLKEWGYLSIKLVKTGVGNGMITSTSLEYVWIIHRLTVENLRLTGNTPELPTSGKGVLPEVGKGVLPTVGKHSNKKNNNTKESSKSESAIQTFKQSKEVRLVHGLATQLGINLDKDEVDRVASLLPGLTKHHGKKSLAVIKDYLVIWHGGNG